MPKAIWNSQVIAESDETQLVDGNHYFPRKSLNMEFFQPSSTTSVCGWKGTANYYTIQVEDQQNVDGRFARCCPPFIGQLSSRRRVGSCSPMEFGWKGCVCWQNTALKEESRRV